jgi:PAS domain S-box-containing protein
LERGQRLSFSPAFPAFQAGQAVFLRYVALSREIRAPGLSAELAGMKNALSVIVVEDSEFDALMMVSLLRKSGYDVTFERVETADALRLTLQRARWEIILADYNLPEFDALSALKILQETGFDIPFIIVSGGIGEDIAVAAMKAGAHDYLMKGNLSRLAPAVERELREAGIRASQREAKKALLESERRYRLLWETCPDAVILMDPQSRMQFGNPAVKDVFGYTPEEIVGMNFSRLLPEQAGGRTPGRLDQYLQDSVRKHNSRAIEAVGRKKDGSEFPIEISYSDMELNGERHFVGFIRDIAERKRAEAELRENEEQFQVARDIQQRLFPKSAPRLAGFDIAGASHPAEATGGDYFDYLPMLHDRLGVLVGDVTGHGIGPALLMAETRAYLRVLAGRREDVGEILTRANSILAEDVGSERFITLFLARLDPSTRSMNYASAGHPAGYLLDAQGRIKRGLPRTGVPLGIKHDTEYASSSPIELESGDLLLLVTDGIEESTSPDDSFFGVERTLDVVRSNQTKSAREIVDALYQAVCAFTQGAQQADDVTAIVIKVL